MYKKILVPLDGSRRAERILKYVEELAHHFGSQLILLRVVEPNIQDVGTQIASSDFYLDSYERWVEEAKTYLAGLQGEFRQRGIQVKTLIEQGRIANTIVDVAMREDVDLVAMASHGRSGLSGSVAAGVLNRIDRPLLLIRSDVTRPNEP